MPATEPAPEVASCSLRNNRRTSRKSSPRITGSSERRMEVGPGAKKHSPRPWIPSSVSMTTKVQSKLPSITAVFRRTIFNLPLNSAAQVGNSSRQIACNPKANKLEGVVTLAIEMAIPPPHSVLHHLQGIVLASLLALGSSARKDERKKACRTRLSVAFRALCSFSCGGVLVLEHGADLVTQLRRVLMAMHRRRVENSEGQNVVFRAGNND